MVRTMYSPTYIVKSAQHMRSRMTTAEGMLWKTLSNWFDDVRFRRQYPIGNHVVDFYCRRLRLIIEISRTGCQVRNGTTHISAHAAIPFCGLRKRKSSAISPASFPESDCVSASSGSGRNSLPSKTFSVVPPRGYIPFLPPDGVSIR